MIQRVTELALGFPEGRLELQLVGGYSDPRNYSEELFCNILCKYFLYRHHHQHDTSSSPPGHSLFIISVQVKYKKHCISFSGISQAASGDRSNYMLCRRIEHYDKR